MTRASHQPHDGSRGVPALELGRRPLLIIAAGIVLLVSTWTDAPPTYGLLCVSRAQASRKARVTFDEFAA